MQLQFKFNPSWRREQRPSDRRLWVLWAVALRIQLQANPLWLFEIYYRRLLAILAALTVAGWLLVVTGLFYWLNLSPHNQVGWLDLAAPWRWPGLRAKRGDAAVLTALDELKVQDYTTAFYNLRVGVSRSPGNVEGRLTIAALQAASEPMHAVALLEEGLPWCGTNPRYLAGLLSLYGRFQIQSHAIGVVDDLLQGKYGLLPSDARFLLQRADVALLLQLGRLPEAQTALAAVTPPTAADRASLSGLRIELLLRTDRSAEAKKLAEAQPMDSAGPLRQLAEIDIALDDAASLQGVLRRLKALSQNEPGAYLFAFQAWHRMKRLSYQDDAEQEYFRLFGRDDSALQAIAGVAVNLELPNIMARAQQAAIAAGLSPFAFRVYRTELALRRGETEPATRFLRDWENDIDTLKVAQRFHPEFIKRLTRTAFSGTPDQITYLLDHLASGRGQTLLPDYILGVTVLEKSGNFAGAGQVLQAGLRIYPESEPLLVAQGRISGELAASSTSKAAAKSAEAAATPATAVVPLPATAEAADARVDALLQQDSLAAARDLLHAIRTQKPAWLAAGETGFAQREIELTFLSLDQLASRAAVRAYLDRYRNEADVIGLIAVVPKLAAHNRPADARLLRDEIAASPAATFRVQQALRDLNLTDDLAAVAATQVAALAALDRALLAQEWTQAGRLLKYLRDQPPPWWAAGQFEVKLREVSIRLGLDQRPLALAALKELVVKGGAMRAACFKLVRDLLGRGEREPAVLLAREIARLLPDDAAAARLLKEAEAPRPAE